MSDVRTEELIQALQYTVNKADWVCARVGQSEDAKRAAREVSQFAREVLEKIAEESLATRVYYEERDEARQ